MSDQDHMRHALALARAQLGRTAPNPSVGCVIVRDGAVIGAAATAASGRPHAEPQALAMAADNGGAVGATVYVTLEPCAHHGATPPCVSALLAARPARVVIATTDPDPRTAGASIRQLQRAGIGVEVGLCGDEALALNAGFFKRLRCGVPLVGLSLDGASYEAPLTLLADERPEDGLARLGRGGLNRVWIHPDNPLVPTLQARGLIDDGGSFTRRNSL